MKVNEDCRYFKGDVPCRYHKSEGVECADCTYYDPIKEKILIIKLGAAGDVIRTTPILRRLKEEFPQAHITWLTLSPELVPADWVDEIFPFDLAHTLVLQAGAFDILYNLDKDVEACALADLVSAHEKKGFLLNSENNKCMPADKEAEHKFLTGIFDSVNKKNTKSYPEEIFEICGFEFAGEKYILNNFSEYASEWKIKEKKPLVGLNTGCGGRWTSRLWPEEYWIELAKRLKKDGKGVLLLGGPDEHEKNQRIARKSGASYLGHFPLQKFINLVDQCDLVITAVTMAMHIAIGLEKKIVLFNNIFNRHEFELYGLGEILEPEMECDCFFSPTCPNECMKTLRVDTVFETCRRLLGE